MIHKHILPLSSLVITMLFLVFASGCVTQTPENQKTERRIVEIYTGDSLSLSRGEILSINMSEIQPKVETMGYTYRNGSSDHIVDYEFSKMDVFDYPELRITIFSSQNVSAISGLYHVSGTFLESELEQKKQYVLNGTKEVATLCNLTVNWTQVHWSVTYAD